MNNGEMMVNARIFSKFLRICDGLWVEIRQNLSI